MRRATSPLRPFCPLRDRARRNPAILPHALHGRGNPADRAGKFVGGNTRTMNQNAQRGLSRQPRVVQRLSGAFVGLHSLAKVKFHHGVVQHAIRTRIVGQNKLRNAPLRRAPRVGVIFFSFSRRQRKIAERQRNGAKSESAGEKDFFRENPMHDIVGHKVERRGAMAPPVSHHRYRGQYGEFR